MTLLAVAFAPRAFLKQASDQNAALPTSI